jgi:hypothetical protein
MIPLPGSRMAFRFSLFALCVLSGFAGAAPTLVAKLDYGTFQGTYSEAYNISYWRKIPFAAPPIGVNRFRAPQPPLPITDGIYDSDQAFDFCPQRTVSGEYFKPQTRLCDLRDISLLK